MNDMQMFAVHQIQRSYYALGRIFLTLVLLLF